MPEIILPNAQDVQDITAKIEEARALLETIETKDFATEETLETRLSNLEAQLQQIIDDGLKQTGSNVEVIKEIINDESIIGTYSRGYGDTVSSPSYAYPIKVSRYKSKEIYVSNNTDVAIAVQVRYMKSADTRESDGNKVLDHNILGSNVEIASGASLLFTPSDYSKLKDYAIGIMIRLISPNGNASSGSVDIIIFGGAN